MSDTTQTILVLPDSLTVRTYEIADIQPLAEIANNRKIWQNMTDRFPHPYTLQSSRSWIEHCGNPENYVPLEIALTNSENAGPETLMSASVPADYAICLNGIPIGACGLQHSQTAPHSIDLGYWLGEPYWGRGIATIVATAFSQWVFDTFLWVVRIGAEADSWNPGSQKVLLKAGFVLEGRQKWKACKEGKFGDVILFGKIREGFEPELFIPDTP